MGNQGVGQATGFRSPRSAVVMGVENGMFKAKSFKFQYLTQIGAQVMTTHSDAAQDWNALDCL